jgi:hypothetical protein
MFNYGTYISRSDLMLRSSSKIRAEGNRSPIYATMRPNAIRDGVYLLSLFPSLPPPVPWSLVLGL